MKAPPPLESKIEADFMRLLKAIPVPLKVRKLNGAGNRSWPDRLILGPKRFMLMIEFKRPQLGKLSEGQKSLFEELGELGHVVPVLDDAHLAVALVKERLIEHGVSLR